MPTLYVHYDAARAALPQMGQPTMIAWVGPEAPSRRERCCRKP